MSFAASPPLRKAPWPASPRESPGRYRAQATGRVAPAPGVHSCRRRSPGARAKRQRPEAPLDLGPYLHSHPQQAILSVSTSRRTGTMDAHSCSPPPMSPGRSRGRPALQRHATERARLRPRRGPPRPSLRDSASLSHPWLSSDRAAVCESRSNPTDPDDCSRVHLTGSGWFPPLRNGNRRRNLFATFCFRCRGTTWNS